nr:DKNYY domain-containing protein [Dyadobacter sp. CY351]
MDSSNFYEEMRYLLGILVVICLVWVCSKCIGCSYKKGVFKPGALTPAGYHIRDHRVYYYGGLMNDSIKELVNVDAATFEIVRLDTDVPGYVSSSYYARDHKQVYYRGYTVPGADPGSFKATGQYSGEDKNHFYDQTRVLPNDPENEN